MTDTRDAVLAALLAPDTPTGATVATVAAAAELTTEQVIAIAVRHWAWMVTAQDAGEQFWISTPGADHIDRLHVPTGRPSSPRATDPITLKEQP